MPSASSISRLLPLAPSVFISVLQVAIFCLSSLQLSALILRRSPANRILFALRQDKHCPCVTPKTFHRLSHFQHGSDIAIIGFFLQRKCSEDTMSLERKKKNRLSNEEEAKQGSGSISTRSPLKCLWEAPHIDSICHIRRAFQRAKVSTEIKQKEVECLIM